ncbi:hypothetical protein SAMN05877753_1047 [Bacillus oleivorans]|uniref:Uncharacterized protein n=1 Tax=Bacillus oleivorans TaxID=1448271 RepID=A0A285CS82_9BACI|nr:hypothetical protein SAMN05877753_1047 [Bacillus oleivorans]
MPNSSCENNLLLGHTSSILLGYESTRWARIFLWVVGFDYLGLYTVTER